jgi:hypothetical protein
LLTSCTKLSPRGLFFNVYASTPDSLRKRKRNALGRATIQSPTKKARATPPLPSFKDNSSDMQPSTHPINTPSFLSTQAESNVSTSPVMRRGSFTAAPRVIMQTGIVSTPLPDQKHTLVDKLLASMKALNVSYKNKSPAIDSLGESSPFGTNTRAVYNFLETKVNAEEGSWAAASLFVFGGSGIGKTMSVEFCCQKIIEKSNQRAKTHDSVEPKVCYINATTMGGATDPDHDIRQRLSAAVGSIHALSYDHVKACLQRRNKLLIVILDEVDSLLPLTTGYGKSLSKGEKSLRRVVELANLQGSPVVVIGISNTVGNYKYERLQTVAPVSPSMFTHKITRSPSVHLMLSFIFSLTNASRSIGILARSSAAL